MKEGRICRGSVTAPSSWNDGLTSSKFKFNNVITENGDLTRVIFEVTFRGLAKKSLL